MFETLPQPDEPVSDDDIVAALRAFALARARLEAAEAAWIQEFEDRGLAARAGARDTADWLAKHCAAAPGTARARVEVARTVAVIPGAGAALAAGSIGSDHVRHLARAAEDVGVEVVAANAAELLGAARRRTPHNFARKTRAFVLSCRHDGGATTTEAHHAQRSATITHDTGRAATVIHAELHDDDAALVTGVLQGLVEELWRAEHGPDIALPDRVELTTRQRLADAFVEMARRAVGATAAMGRSVKPSVIVLMDHQSLIGQIRDVTVDPEACTLADGTQISPATARRLACEANIVPAVLDGRSQPLDLGRSQRLASAAQRSAMLARSSRCEFPDCLIPSAWCEAHHLIPWQCGGTTDIANLAWQCRAHHHLVHEGGWHLARDPDGTMRSTAPPAGPDRSDLDPPASASPPTPDLVASAA